MNIEKIISLQKQIIFLEKEIEKKKEELNKYKICYCGDPAEKGEQCSKCENSYGSPPLK